ncbi:MAG: hypothetical protein JWN34_474 [Bryobacterales bacterium]|nr:hypothetical protein [Bryobacterales bacterium]
MNIISNLQDVVQWELCTGCGACSYACQSGNVTLIDIQSTGIRPQFNHDCGGCQQCIRYCPGYNLDAQFIAGKRTVNTRGEEEFGYAPEIWEGYAADPEIRFKASSGGVLTALALFCLERMDMGFVLHTGSDPDSGWRNTTVKSHTRAELLSRTGSRYAPSSPCDRLAEVEASDVPCVFIGKPCDAAAVSMLSGEREQLRRRLGLVLTFFCAGTPSSDGTVKLLESLGVEPAEVADLRYRGEGWPGVFRATLHNGVTTEPLSYEQSWGKLTSFRPLRCNLCPDGLGRLADISCGDPWHQPTGADPGRSLVIVRTERGRSILRQAVEAGYIHLTPSSAESVMQAQTNLLSRRRELFGRLAAMRMLNIPTPRFTNFLLLRSWLRLSFQRRVTTVFGTLRRAVVRRWYRRREYKPEPFRGQDVQ